MATDNHGIGLQFVFYLLGGGSEHVDALLSVVEVVDFHVVADSFDIQEVGYL